MRWLTQKRSTTKCKYADCCRYFCVVAWLNHDDVWNTHANVLKNFFLETGAQPTYFDCVVAEALSAATRRLHEKKRGYEVATLFTRLETLVPVGLITWILPDVPRLYSAALDLMRASSGELNFNDASSFRSDKRLESGLWPRSTTKS